ncbi:hypothetical protein BaRGS_00020269 [Batillaria attramentaria]|uniref:Amino acid transporter transmembrane domain-containing protein n=1 Tax=Batillaria attramentaria TaxID=370345 RepID=A0ABD0KN58_9CAEN
MDAPAERGENGASANGRLSQSRNYRTVQQQSTEEEERVIRRPIAFHWSINNADSNGDDVEDLEKTALLARYKYISRLDPSHESRLVMPAHIVPEEYLIRILVPIRGRQSSLVTIFAFWNTMMGTSLLSMPWAIQQAGYVCGIVMLVVMAFIMGYTAYRVLKSVDFLVGQTVQEFSDVCRHYLGRYAEMLAISCSLLALLGGMIVYWILMTNFLYHIVYFIFCRFLPLGALGTLSVMYLLIFATVKASHWGFHLQLSTGTEFSTDEPYLTPGISALAYFVHNCVLTVTANQEKPENNVRDLVIAYTLVAVTYMYMGIVFYTSYPMAKSCIEDNLLNNMASSDIMSFIARIGLFLQMMCVFPLLCYILRVQVLQAIFGNGWPSWRHVGLLNIILVGVCLVFAVFLPHIGKIIGFVGAFCGLTYAIALPCIVYILACRQSGTLTWPKLVFHCVLIAIGVANFIAQFVLLGVGDS